MKQIVMSFMLACLAFGANAADVATAVFNVNPPMSCDNCENKIKNNLRYEKGVKKVATSISNQAVTVTYDPAKTTPEQLAQGFEKIGYKATVAASSTASTSSSKAKKVSSKSKSATTKCDNASAKSSCCSSEAKAAKTKNDAKGSCCKAEAKKESKSAYGDCATKSDVKSACGSCSGKAEANCSCCKSDAKGDAKAVCGGCKDSANSKHKELKSGTNDKCKSQPLTGNKPELKSDKE